MFITTGVTVLATATGATMGGGGRDHDAHALHCCLDHLERLSRQFAFRAVSMM